MLTFTASGPGWSRGSSNSSFSDELLSTDEEIISETTPLDIDVEVPINVEFYGTVILMSYSSNV